MRHLIDKLRSFFSSRRPDVRDDRPSQPSLRCRPGDVVMFKRDGRCLLRGVAYQVPCSGVVATIKEMRPDGLWGFDSPFHTKGAVSECGRFWRPMFTIDAALDDLLQPLRPSEDADETLTWAGKPEKIEA